MIPCMGGGCSQRDRCAHYYVESNTPPAERLCDQQERPVYFHESFELETVH